MTDAPLIHSGDPTMCPRCHERTVVRVGLLDRPDFLCLRGMRLVGGCRARTRTT